MIDLTDTDEQNAPVRQAGANRPPLWLATILTVSGLAALLLAWFSGYSTAYCDTLGDALVWVVFFTAAVVFAAFRDYWHVFPVGLIACIALAAVVRRFQPVKVTWLRFLIALLCVYGAMALFTWLRDVHGACRII
ncbi:hypothetical protein G3O00_02435 [Burkholderia sp. Ac-20384]|uniref:hypothetical protein n=1 Tax=Burkholderia sp. Ac-20384 TaxID=2703902 RepID=UPI00197FE23E|nr:hypothetical protein [Burkholderia sp. Ac-20384]MBN3822475.1 hypothetical protein [Burkholderia sp. Ac-20384]